MGGSTTNYIIYEHLILTGVIILPSQTTHYFTLFAPPKMVVVWDFFHQQWLLGLLHLHWKTWLPRKWKKGEVELLCIRRVCVFFLNTPLKIHILRFGRWFSFSIFFSKQWKSPMFVFRMCFFICPCTVSVLPFVSSASRTNALDRGIFQSHRESQWGEDSCFVGKNCRVSTGFGFKEAAQCLVAFKKSALKWGLKRILVKDLLWRIFF